MGVNQGSRPIDDGVLVAYVDRELEPAAMARVEALIAEDPAVRARVATFRRADMMLRAAFAQSADRVVSPDLERQVRRLLARRRPRGYTKALIPLAAAIAGIVIGGLSFPNFLPVGDRGGDEREIRHVLDEVAEYHAIFAAETEHLVEVPASRAADIEAWLGRRVQLAFNVPNLERHGLAFQGARMLAIDGKPVAQLIYRGQAAETVALCVTMSEHNQSSPIERLDENGLTLFGEATGRHVFVIVGPTGNRAVAELGRTLPALFAPS